MLPAGSAVQQAPQCRFRALRAAKLRASAPSHFKPTATDPSAARAEGQLTGHLGLGELAGAACPCAAAAVELPVPAPVAFKFTRKFRSWKRRESHSAHLQCRSLRGTGPGAGPGHCRPAGPGRPAANAGGRRGPRLLRGFGLLAAAVSQVGMPHAAQRGAVFNATYGPGKRSSVATPRTCMSFHVSSGRAPDCMHIIISKPLAEWGDDESH